MTSLHTDIAIIGGGLSGLAVAAELQQRNADWHLFESRSRLGGRALSAGPTHADMGPGWTWPGDRRVAALADALSLRLFTQFTSGKLIFQDASGAVRRDLDMALMAGARRVEGGTAALTTGLSQRLPSGQVHIGAGISAIRPAGTGFILTSATNVTVSAQHVVLALPPRVALQSIEGLRNLSPVSATHLPTWMAGQAKAVAVYDRPFWREAGFSGEAISHLGPLSQIHDASSVDGSAGALIGFLGSRPVTLEMVSTQLAALFGIQAATPREVFIQDWAVESETTSAADMAEPGQPQAHMARALRGDHRLIWAGAEAAVESTGLLEGALAAAEYAAAVLFGQASAVQNDNALA